MQPNDIFNKLKEEFGDSIIELVGEAPSDLYIKVAPESIFDICLHLRDESSLLFDYLTLLSGLDLGEELCVVYQLYSFQHKHRITLKAFINKEEPKLPTVERVWRAADWHERETYDMYGIIFEGHHNLIRILCPYDWEGFPLRKDYKHPEEYHGIPVPY